MRITNNTVSENIVRQIQDLGNKQARLQQQVASGQRIFQPEDDPTAMGRVLNLESEQRQIAQYMRNADRAFELSQATFSGLQQIKRVSDRAAEIGTLGIGAISGDAKRAYASEVDQLLQQTMQLANTKFRNDYLFAGTKVADAPFQKTEVAGKITAVKYVGADSGAEIQLSENARITPGTSGATNEGLAEFLNQLVALRDALLAGDTVALTSLQSGLEESENTLVTALAEHGGVQTRVEANRAQLQTRADSLETLVAGETEVDLPATIVRLNQNQTAYQAALQSAANIMRISLLDYIR